MFRLLANLSTRPEVFDPPASFVFLVRTEVKPELASAYELSLAKLKAAGEQAPNSPTAIRRVAVQGLSYTYTTALFFNKYVEREGWPSPGELLRKAYGEAEARHIEQSSLQCIRKREFLVLAYRPDLSRPTAGPAAQRQVENRRGSAVLTAPPRNPGGTGPSRLCQNGSLPTHK